MEPKVGQIWRYATPFENGETVYEYIFVTKVTSNGHAVHYFSFDDPERSVWDYTQSFVENKSYEFVSG